MVWPAIIAAVGGKMAANMGAASSEKDRNAQNYWNQRNLDYQDLVNRNQIQWRVADAVKAGLHPLAALGISPSQGGGVGWTPVGDGGASGHIANMGQDISRAMIANMDRRERTAANAEAARQNAVQEKRNEILFGLSVERAGLENAELRSRIARINSAQVGPGQPRIGRSVPTSTGVIESVPSPVHTSERGNPALQAGAPPEYRFYRRSDGRLGIQPSEQMSQTFEDNMPGMVDWHIRNNLLPRLNVSNIPAPPRDRYPNRPGYRWRYNHIEGAFEEVRDIPRRRVRQGNNLGNRAYGH